MQYHNFEDKSKLIFSLFAGPGYLLYMPHDEGESGYFDDFKTKIVISVDNIFLNLYDILVCKNNSL